MRSCTGSILGSSMPPSPASDTRAPESDPSYDVITQAMGGAMSVTGFPEMPPTKAGVSLGDYLGGFNAAIAILSALYYRSLSGKGQVIDISMQDSVWALVLPDRADYFVTP